MQKTHHISVISESVNLANIVRYGDGWLLDAEVRQFSSISIGLHKTVLDKLLWFVRTKEIQDVGKLELRQFLAYFNSAHQQAGGRRGMERIMKAVRTRTVQIYYSNLKTLFRFMFEEDPRFTSDRGIGAGDALTRNGLYQLIRRLGRAAGIEAIRCSPHSF